MVTAEFVGLFQQFRQRFSTDTHWWPVLKDKEIVLIAAWGD